MVGDIPDAAAAASVAGEEDNVPDFVLAGDEAAGAALAVVLDVQGTADVENGEALLDVASKADAAAALGEEGIGAGAFDGTVALCRHIVAREVAEDGGRGAVTQVAAAAVEAVAVAALESGPAAEEPHATAAGPVDGKEAAGAAEASARSHDEADIGDAAVVAAAVGAAAVVEGMVDKGYGWDCRRADDEGFGGVKVAVPSAEMDIAAAAVAAEKVAFVEAGRARAYREGTPATMSLTPWRGAGRSPPVFLRAPSPRGAP